MPGVYVREVTCLPHPLQCVSTGLGALTGPLSQAAMPGLVADFAGGHHTAPNTFATRLPLAGGINLLNSFPAQGNIIWGARTTTSDPAWQFIEVRRLMIYIEQSLSQGVQWAVFQNNGPSLWAQVSNTVANFLQNLFQQGALQGNSSSQAYFVKCDLTTMTQNDLDSGRLVMIVGFAPVRPAEFAVLQIIVQTRKK